MNCQTLNKTFDTLVRPDIPIFGRRVSMFIICGAAGYILSVILGVVVTKQIGLDPWVTGWLALSAAATFFGLAMATKIVTGAEQLVYYHHEIAIMLITSAILWATGLPLLAYLEIVNLGVGLFLACGRLGCLNVGCCHGRPHNCGVSYSAAHAKAGFTRYYVGVRLFPIQLVESLTVFVIVGIGCWLILGGFAPGTSLAWYLVSYSIARFYFEFLRGDPERPYHSGFSEAQWISVTLVTLVLAGGLTGILPFFIWQPLALALLVATMIVVTFARRRQPLAMHALLNPRHIEEIADIVEAPEHAGGIPVAGDGQGMEAQNVFVGCTSSGVRISASRTFTAEGEYLHYALAAEEGELKDEIASVVAQSIARIKHLKGEVTLLKGNSGIYHLSVPAAAANRATGKVKSGYR